MKKIYYATFSTNNDNTYGSYTFSNKRTAIKDIIEIAKGNRYEGNTSNWCVTGIDGVIKKGWIDKQGNNHYIN